MEGDGERQAETAVASCEHDTTFCVTGCLLFEMQERGTLQK